MDNKYTSAPNLMQAEDGDDIIQKNDIHLEKLEEDNPNTIFNLVIEGKSKCQQ